MGKRRFPADQTHTKCDENAVLAVRDTLELLQGTTDSVAVKKRRAVEILKGLWQERSTDLDRSFIYEDAEAILKNPGV